MARVYRVVVSENQKLYPDQTYIDFAPAASSTHEIILKMRQKIYPGLQILTDGLHLYDFGNGNIQFKTETPNDREFVDYPAEILGKYQNQIILAYQRMREANLDQTINVQDYDMAEIFDFYSKAVPEAPISAREADLRNKSKYYQDLEEKRRDLLYRRHKRYERS